MFIFIQGPEDETSPRKEGHRVLRGKRPRSEVSKVLKFTITELRQLGQPDLLRLLLKVNEAIIDNYNEEQSRPDPAEKGHEEAKTDKPKSLATVVDLMDSGDEDVTHVA